jgi:hypothetical protein
MRGAGSRSGLRTMHATIASLCTIVPATDSQLMQLMIWARKQVGNQYNYLDIIGLLIRNRRWTTPNRLICSQFCTLGLLEVYGASRVLNVLGEYAYLITPETLHLSPLFVGRLVRKYDRKLWQDDHDKWADS